MSNPTIATKLKTLVQGIFGRKEPVTATVSVPKDEDTASTDTAAETVETPAETPDEAPTESAAAEDAEEKKDEATEAVAEPAAEEGEPEAKKPEAKKPEAKKAEPKKAAAKKAKATTEDTSAEGASAKESSTGTAGDGAPAANAEAVEAAEVVEAPEEAAPAVNVEKDGAAIAEELAVAEAHTEVASDEVFEKVRKGAAPAAEDLAVPTYDELTLPSIRARLRKLTIEQVRDLRAYEVAHQGRPEFIKMYDNRIAKLESGE